MNLLPGEQSGAFAAQMGHYEWWILFLMVSGIAYAGCGFVYNRFIDGRICIRGRCWDQDDNTDLSVVIGNGMVTLSIIFAYAVAPHRISWVELLLIMMWYWSAWGLPMILGYRQRGIQAARDLSMDLLRIGRGGHDDKKAQEVTGKALAGEPGNREG